MRTNHYLRFLRNSICSIFLLISFTGTYFVSAQTPGSTIFTDDFTRTALGDFWDAHPSWSIVNGAAFSFIDGTGGTLRTVTAYPQTSYIIETTARGFNNNYGRKFRVTFGQDDLAIDKMYQLIYTAEGGGILSLNKNTGGASLPVLLDKAAIFPELNSSIWYTFKIAKYKSGLIQVYVDKGAGYSAVPLLEAIDLTYKTLAHTGWEVDTETSPEAFYVDSVSAYEPAKEKAAVKEKPVEDGLITQVSAKSGKAYKVAKLTKGVKQVIDRDYTITSVPEYLNGASFIQTANVDKSSTADSFLTFFVKSQAIVYIAYDPRSTSIPAWLSGWFKTGDRIGTSDAKAGYLNVYSKLFESGQVFPHPIVLGSNLAKPAQGAETNYFVAAIKRPVAKKYQAENALLSGAVVASNHPGYIGTGFADFKNPSKDFIEWTVQIDVPGTYNLGFTFSNGSSANRSLQITDNGTKHGTAVFPVNGSWSTWSFLSGPNIFLSPGVHKIRISATGTSGPNMDQLSIYLVSASAPVALLRNTLAINDLTTTLYGSSIKVYPNPFLQSTKICYSVKSKSMVMLWVYTLQGQQIEMVKKGMHEAGNYEAVIDCNKLAKGIYLYRLQIGTDVKQGKLIKQ